MTPDLATIDRPHLARARRSPGGRCSGFTLLELSLVLGIMVLLLGLSWPLLERPLAYERLRHAGEQVMAQWIVARNDAMRLGADQKFTYQPGSDTYNLTSDPSAEGSKLPDGVIFVSSIKEQDTRQSFGESGSSDLGSPEIWFYPDGTCSDVPELLLRNEYGMQIRLILRGLTGVTRMEDNVPDAADAPAGGNR